MAEKRQDIISLLLATLLAQTVFPAPGTLACAASKDIAAPATPAAASATPGEAASGREAASFLETMRKAAAELNDYVFQTEMVCYKKRSVVRESADYYFKKPRLIRLEVTSGPRKGALAVLKKDGKVHGHLGGFFRFISGEVDSKSGLVNGENGYCMMDSDFLTLIVAVQDMLFAGHVATVGVQANMSAGRNCRLNVLDIYRLPKSPKNLIKRVLVNPQTFLPEEWQEFIDGRMSSRTVWKNLRVNCGLNDDLFK